jgi:hypothetical protein
MKGMDRRAARANDRVSRQTGWAQLTCLTSPLRQPLHVRAALQHALPVVDADKELVNRVDAYAARLTFN